MRNYTNIVLHVWVEQVLDVIQQEFLLLLCSG